MKRLRTLAAVITVVTLAALPALAQFSDVRDIFRSAALGGSGTGEFVRSIATGVTPDSQLTFTIDLRGGAPRSVGFYFQANRAAVAGAATCSLAVLQVSQNDTTYVDASSVPGLVVNDNLTGYCVTESCGTYNRYIEAVATGNNRIRWSFARGLVFWKVTVAGGKATSWIDFLRMWGRVQYD